MVKSAVITAAATPPPVTRELPGEVLPEIGDLSIEAGLAVEQRRLAVLYPVQDVHQRLAEEADRLALVDRRVLSGSEGQPEVVERDAHHHGEHAEVDERVARRPPQRIAEDAGGGQQQHDSLDAVPVEHLQPLAAHREEQEPERHDGPRPHHHPPVGPDDVDHERGERQEAQQVVRGREREDVSDEHEPAIAMRSQARRRPSAPPATSRSRWTGARRCRPSRSPWTGSTRSTRLRPPARRRSPRRTVPNDWTRYPEASVRRRETRTRPRRRW